MLETLRIRNLALIEDLLWEPKVGLNILTGETGAGKSILIDALTLLLGERASKTMIRTGADQCSVEACITPDARSIALLEELGCEPCGEGPMILRRTFGTSGASRQFVNNSPATLQALKQLGDLLVDLHGPHDHQSLLSTTAQCEALDAFGRLEPMVEEVRQLALRRAQWCQELAQLTSGDPQSWQQRLDLIDHQIGELEAAQLQENEEETLEQNYRIASNTQRLQELTALTSHLLEGHDAAVLNQLAQAARALEELSAIDAQTTAWRQQLDSAIILLRELGRDLERYASHLETEPSQLAQLEQRIHLIESLKRKFRCQRLSDLMTRLQALRQERADWANREERLASLTEKLAALDRDLQEKAHALHTARTRTAPALAKAITQQLRDLGFHRAVFSCQCRETSEINVRGKTAVEFLFASHTGEQPRPLRQVASSGEMARVMLAIKTVLAAQDRIPILIFDEVDANVGGETAVAVGQKLRALAQDRQVLCITHLPQVAAAGHHHFRVEKVESRGRTTTQVVELDLAERTLELARMLGGDSPSARELASSLLQRLSQPPPNP